jgi:hypothetical protein
MDKAALDFIQIGFLRLNLIESLEIIARNIYNEIVRRGFVPQLFDFFGFKEAKRATTREWRRELPSNFVLNDVRYGAHGYLISKKFAAQISQLNNPAFLAADDFYVALSKMKSFRMIRIKNSKIAQGESSWGLTPRYGVDQ